MTMQEIKAMPVAQKLQIMELLWEDMRDRFEHTTVSPVIKELLDRRQTRVREGTAEILNWDSVKDSIGKA